MRCLDVNVPPNDPEMARLSREILRCCVRNTELVAAPSFALVGDLDPAGRGRQRAQTVDDSRGTSSLSMSEDLDLLFGGSARGGVWGLIERSELAKGVKQNVERERVGLERSMLKQAGGKAKLEVWKKTPEEVLKTARDLVSPFISSIFSKFFSCSFDCMCCVIEMRYCWTDIILLPHSFDLPRVHLKQWIPKSFWSAQWRLYLFLERWPKRKRMPLGWKSF